MGVAALITWLITAAGGAFLLFLWLSHGGLRQQRTGPTRFPAPLILGHFALAAAGLVVWIVYLATDTEGLAWTSFVVLLVVAVLGLTMLARWIPVYQGKTLSRSGAVAEAAAGAVTGAGATPAERHFRPAVVAAHGVFAVVTVVLVLLASLG